MFRRGLIEHGIIGEDFILVALPRVLSLELPRA